MEGGNMKKLKLSENALKVLEKRYLKRNEKGEIIETPEELFRRVARAIAEVDKDYPYFKERVSETEEKFYEIMAEGYFLPNSPTLMNAGTPLGQLSACFVLPIEDSMEGIFETLKHAAIIHKTGGGTGFSFSKLRPKGDIVRTTGQIASGPVSFMKVFNAATEAVKQGGRRRGANMGVLRVDHPDILEFITCKDDVREITNFNISVAVTEKFMKAVLNDEEYELINPRLGKPVKKLRAKEVFEKIAYQAWKNGEPGIIFIDRINETHTLKNVGEIEATNPCVSGDTWIITPYGPYKVEEIVGKFIAIGLNGKFYRTNEDGFFLTGEKDVFKIITKKGYELKATQDHLIRIVQKLTRYKRYENWKKVGELEAGDKIVLSNNREIYWTGKGKFEEGYLLGLLIGDGTLKKEGGIICVWGNDEGAKSVIYEAEKAAKILPHRKDFKGFVKILNKNEYRLKMASIRELARKYGIVPGKKVITEEIEKTSYEFYQGFLRGIFDTDGTILSNLKKGVSIRLWQNSLNNLKIIQRMLLRMGIVSQIYKYRKKEGKKLLPDGKGGYKYYQVKEGHELVISKDNIKIFAEKIGFGNIEKEEKLKNLLSSYKRKLNRERFIDEIEKIEYCGKEKVYDVQVPGINAFDANGFYVHNCGEKPLLPYESCNLGSINVAKFYKGTPWYLREKRRSKWEEVKDMIDWEKLGEIVDISVHFLDNVVDANNYPLKEIEKLTKENRKIGLGIMGFADLLYILGIPYRSEEAIRVAEEIMKFVQERAHNASCKIGKIKGAFPNIEKSIFKGTTRRNAVVTTIAPTGTISMIADTSAGIEPNFSLVYVKNVMEGERLLYINKYFEEAAKFWGFYSDELMNEISKVPSIKPFDEIPDFIRDIFDVTFDVDYKQHVMIQAAFQKYTEDAVSKTINMPESATVQDVKKAFLLAYELGCKGITVYRTGSRPEQVYDVPVKKEEEKKTHILRPKPRPKVVSGKTYKMPSGLGTLYITVNEDEEGLLEVFIQVGKSGGHANALTEAIGRLISLALRSGVSPNEIIKQLKGIRSANPIWEDGEVYFSIPDTIAKVLEKHLGKGEQLKIFPEPKRKILEGLTPSGEICPECGASLVMIEDCATCLSCGYSKCE
jgi:ribonucleoside-diphosphate reductase alpha chain